jgi:predicted component of type VI protein secretion system
MLLALSVMGSQGVELGPIAYKVFDKRGGSIGRLESNDWTLPDPERFVSTHHATVAYEEGAWRLADVSTNGTFLNAPDRPVNRGQPVALRDGDRIFIGGYEILVQLVDIDEPPDPAPVSAQAAGAAAPIRSATPDAVAPARTVMPDATAPTRADMPDAQTLEIILRTVVQGLIGVLQTRAQVKNQFRMSMTSIKPVENNPLKFSRTAQDALHCLFTETNPGYLPPTESFREAFEDIGFHQLAMLAGVRGAFNAMLASFHPDRLEAQYAKRLRRASFVSVFGRLRYWAMYRAQFEEIEADPEAHFQLLFGEEFARAYADQLQSLQAARQRSGR